MYGTRKRVSNASVRFILREQKAERQGVPHFGSAYRPYRCDKIAIVSSAVGTSASLTLH
jgi:hypothetical protein